eukprot:GHVT01082398.1.p1 GENE.GHVT01082398.1~~GHVT01082398.1.p1  ORF type:complete len:159 (+),score=24.79 GHVT01082398.1:853-1329(+)
MLSEIAMALRLGGTEGGRRPFSLAVADYQPALLFQLLGRLFSICQYSFLLLTLLTAQVWTFYCTHHSWLSTFLPLPAPSAGANTPMPPWLANLQENKVTIALTAFFVGNVFKSLLLGTPAAFEVFLGNQLIWSGLARGSPPPLPVLMQALNQAAIRRT